jgi:ribosomal protein S21
MTNVKIHVQNNDVNTALRKLRKACERGGVMTAMLEHEFYRNPSTWRRLEKARSQARRRKLAKKVL